MKRKVLSFLSGVLFPASLSLGCSGGAAPREADLEIAHFREPCVGLEPLLCLRVADSSAGPWSRFYDSIAGLDPQWGTSYRIRVEVTDVPNPPPDGSSLAYRLLEVLSQATEPQSTEFSMAFEKDESSLLMADSTGALQLAAGPKLDCSDGAACQAARAWAAMPSGTLRLTLHHPANPGTELVVTASSSNGSN